MHSDRMVRAFAGYLIHAITINRAEGKEDLTLLPPMWGDH